MLILTMFPGDEVIIGVDTTLKLFGMNEYGQVKIGVEAPNDVVIDRKIIRDRREEKIKEVLEKHIHG